MTQKMLRRVVIDTNVLFDGLTQQQSAAGLFIEAWLKGLLDVYNL
jgi:predicted nucleic acid-binding protein